MKQLTARLFFACIIMMLFAMDSWSQDRYTWQNGEKVTLQAVADQFVVYIADSLYSQALLQFPFSYDTRHKVYQRQVLWIKGEVFEQAEKQLKNVDVPVYISPVFTIENDGFKHTNGEILIRWNEDVDDDQIHRLEQKYQLRRIEGERAGYLGETLLYEYMPPYHVTSLDVANTLQESG